MPISPIPTNSSLPSNVSAVNSPRAQDKNAAQEIDKKRLKTIEGSVRHHEKEVRKNLDIKNALANKNTLAEKTNNDLQLLKNESDQTNTDLVLIENKTNQLIGAHGESVFDIEELNQRYEELDIILADIKETKEKLNKAEVSLQLFINNGSEENQSGAFLQAREILEAELDEVKAELDAKPEENDVTKERTEVADKQLVAFRLQVLRSQKEALVDKSNLIKQKVEVADNELEKINQQIAQLKIDETKSTKALRAAEQTVAEAKSETGLSEGIIHKELIIKRHSKSLEDESCRIHKDISAIGDDLTGPEARTELKKIERFVGKVKIHLEKLEAELGSIITVKTSRPHMDTVIANMDALVDKVKGFENALLQSVTNESEEDEIHPTYASREKIGDIHDQYQKLRPLLLDKIDEARTLYAKGYSQVSSQTHDKKSENMYRQLFDRKLHGGLGIGSRINKNFQERVLPTSISKKHISHPVQPKHEDHNSSITRASNTASKLLNYEQDNEGALTVFKPRFNENITTIIGSAENLDEETSNQLKRYEELATIIHESDTQEGENSNQEVLNDEFNRLSDILNKKAYNLRKDTMIEELVQDLKIIGIELDREEFFDEDGIPFDAKRAQDLCKDIESVKTDLLSTPTRTHGLDELQQSSNTTGKSRVHIASTFEKSHKIMDVLGLANRNLESDEDTTKKEKIKSLISGDISPEKMKNGLKRAIEYGMIPFDSPFDNLNSLSLEDLDKIDTSNDAGRNQLKDIWVNLIESFARTTNDEKLLNIELSSHQSRKPTGVLQGLVSTITNKVPQNTFSDSLEHILPFSDGQPVEKTKREIESLITNLASTYNSEKRKLQVKTNLVEKTVKDTLDDLHTTLMGLEEANDLNAIRDEIEVTQKEISDILKNNQTPDEALYNKLDENSLKLTSKIQNLWNSETAQPHIKNTYQKIESSLQGLIEQTGADSSLKVKMDRIALGAQDILFNKIASFKGQTASFSIFPITGPFYTHDAIRDYDSDAPDPDLSAPRTPVKKPSTRDALLFTLDDIGTAGGIPNKFKMAFDGTKSLIRKPGEFMSREDKKKLAENKLAELDKLKGQYEKFQAQGDVEKLKLVIDENNPSKDSKYDRFFQFYDPVAALNSGVLLTHAVVRQSENLRAGLSNSINRLPPQVIDKLAKHGFFGFAVVGPISYGSRAAKDIISATKEYNHEKKAREQNFSQDEKMDKDLPANQLDSFLSTNKTTLKPVLGAGLDILAYNSALIPMFVSPKIAPITVPLSFAVGTGKDTLSLGSDMIWNAIHDTTSERMASFMSNTMSQEDIQRLKDKFGVQGDTEQLTKEVVAEIATREPKIILDSFVEKLREELPRLSDDDISRYMDLKEKAEKKNKYNEQYMQELKEKDEKLATEIQARDAITKLPKAELSSDDEEKQKFNSTNESINTLEREVASLANKITEITEAENELEKASDEIIQRSRSSTANYLKELGLKPSQLVAIAGLPLTKDSDKIASDIIKMQLKNYFQASYFRTAAHLNS